MGRSIIYRGAGGNLYNLLYAELEYIESTGTQYINTNYYYNNSNNNGRLVTKYIPVEVNSTYYSLRNGGSYSGGANRALILYGSSSDGRLGVGGGDVSLGYSFAANTLYEVDLTAAAGNITGIINGTSIGTKTYSGNNYSSQPYFLFCNNENGSPGNYGKIKLYYYKLYDNNELVRDFIPVMNTQSYEVGLYDKVNKQFYKNAGTGTFKYAFKNLREAGKCCKWMNYIQSSGTQYITTAVPSTLTLTSEIKVNSQYIGESAMFGSTWSLNGNFLMFYNNGIRWHSAAAVDIPCNMNTDYVIKTENGHVQVNNANYNCTASTSVSSSVISIFCTTDNKTKNGRFKLYYLKFWNNGILIADYIPFKFKENSTCGLYDKVENKIYLNAGSGSFTCG